RRPARPARRGRVPRACGRRHARRARARHRRHRRRVDRASRSRTRRAPGEAERGRNAARARGGRRARDPERRAAPVRRRQRPVPLLRREGRGLRMAAVEQLTGASRLPGPPELLPGKPDAVVDLQTETGTALVDGEWRYADAHVEEIEFVAVGSPEDPLGPGTVPNRTYDVLPHAEAPDFDDSRWRALT